MKTDTREVVTRTNQPNRESIKMSFDEDGAAHLARLVTDLYADPASACLREYPANGLDSHILAGQTRAVEVTLPTDHNPTLIVQDWGVGMSKRDIIDIYSKYGASTKRTSNSFIGAFGLGCKSALSMTPSFVLTSVKNNQKIIAIIHRGSDGVGNIEFVNETETHEPNGVTISIPVTDGIKDYAAKAKAIFVTWPKGSILIDGKAPALSITSEDDFLPLGDVAHLSRTENLEGNRYRANGSLIVNMGGIGYLVARDQASKMIETATVAKIPNINPTALSHIRHTLMYSLTMVVNVDLGSVDLVPSRESVRWTQKSTETVQNNIYKAIANLPEALAADFADCTTYAEVLSKETMTFASQFREIYASVKWNNELLPSDLQFFYANTNNFEDDGVTNYTISYAGLDRVPVRRDSDHMAFSFGFSSRAARSFELNKTANPDASKQYVFVKVEDAQEYRKRVSGYFNSYLADQRNRGIVHSSTVVIGYTDDMFSNPWLSAVFDSPVKNITMTKLTVDEIVDTAKAYRKATRNYTPTGSSTPTVRTAVRYDTWVMDNAGKLNFQSIPAEEIDALVQENDYTLYLDNMELIDAGDYKYAWNRMSPFMPHGSVVVSVGANRKFEALQKRITSTVSNTLVADLETVYNARIASITAKDFFRNRNGNITNSLTDVHAHIDKLNDGFLKSILVEKKDTGNANELIDSVFSVFNSKNLKLTPENEGWTDKFTAVADSVMKKFPMIWFANRSYQIDRDTYALSVVEYLNFKHDEIEEMFAAIK